ncbi:MAG TPA: SDR family NAD(P)-dependent oxidoreductase, partial [Streptosporangiaceae bacterium]
MNPRYSRRPAIERTLRGPGVIVTGGGRGIGEATARAFASEGADVLVLGRTIADLERAVGQIIADG